MKLVKVLAAGIAALGISAGSAMATDAGPMAPTVAVAPPAGTTFSWNRFFVGTYGGVWTDSFYGRAGVIAGRNVQINEHFVIGVEGTFGLWDFSDPAVEVAANARAGILLGDRVLVFALVGYYYDFYGPEDALNLGGGIEIAVADNVSLRLDVTPWFTFGPFAFDDVNVSVGFNWHIGH